MQTFVLTFGTLIKSKKKYSKRKYTNKFQYFLKAYLKMMSPFKSLLSLKYSISSVTELFYKPYNIFYTK